MKLFYSLCCCIMLCMIPVLVPAQIPAIQHPDPPGVTITNARMNQVAFDAANSKWIAFANYGIGIYDGATWTMLNTTNSGLPSDSITCLAFTAASDAWIGTKLGAVLKSGTNYTVYDAATSGLPGDIITALFTDGGNTWFGTYLGLAKYDGSNWTIFNTANSSLSNDSITKITKDPSGNLWIGTRDGLNKFDGNSWTTYITSNSVLSRFIIDLDCDAYGRVWVAHGNISIYQIPTTSGVHFIQNGIVKNFIGDIYGLEISFNYYSNTNLFTDNSGNIWFRVNTLQPGLMQSGLMKVQQGNFTFYELPFLNPGLSMFGTIFEMDLNGIIWYVPHNRFYFYSLDPSGYTVPSTFAGLHSYRTLDINEVKAGINVRGDMHWDLNNARYEVPKGSGKNSVFASGLWIGGLDQGGQIHLAGQTYRQTGIDYWPGPIAGISVPFDTASCIQFNRIWKMDKWKIEEFNHQFSIGNVTNGSYQVPEEIATWPAKGNGQVIADLAPYVDFNNDGTYNPMDGDYPRIRGDQMLYHVFNDSLGIHTETGAQKLGVEVQQSSYAFNCQNIADSNLVLKHTTFYHFDIINRSSTDYDSVFVGFWSDMDLGNAEDDYVGCDTSRAASFTYNGDMDDETMNGYGISPPMQNIKVLQGTLADPGDGIDNDVDGTIDEPGERTSLNSFMYYYNINNVPVGNPYGYVDFYNYLHAVWQDGSHLTYGGGGWNSSNILTNFMFSGVPYSGTGWTETSSGNAPGDRRFLMGSGPFSLDAGDTATFDIAYVFTRDTTGPNGLNTSIARNQQDLDRVQMWFDSNSFPSCEVYTVSLPEVINPNESLLVFPNPATDKISIYSGSEQLTGTPYKIYDMLGREVLSGIVSPLGIYIASLPVQSYVVQCETSHGLVYGKFVRY